MDERPRLSNGIEIARRRRADFCLPHQRSFLLTRLFRTLLPCCLAEVGLRGKKSRSDRM